MNDKPFRIRETFIHLCNAKKAVIESRKDNGTQRSIPFALVVMIHPGSPWRDHSWCYARKEVSDTVSGFKSVMKPGGQIFVFYGDGTVKER